MISEFPIDINPYVGTEVQGRQERGEWKVGRTLLVKNAWLAGLLSFQVKFSDLVTQRKQFNGLGKVTIVFYSHCANSFSTQKKFHLPLQQGFLSHSQHRTAAHINIQSDFTQDGVRRKSISVELVLKVKGKKNAWNLDKKSGGESFIFTWHSFFWGTYQHVYFTLSLNFLYPSITTTTPSSYKATGN